MTTADPSVGPVNPRVRPIELQLWAASRPTMHLSPQGRARSPLPAPTAGE